MKIKMANSTTCDPNDPELHRGVDTEETAQHKKYLVLCDEDRASGRVRPFRDAYRHDVCGTVTTMAREIAETYAKQPTFYGATYCIKCRKHLPVSEFTWMEMDGKEIFKVGS